MIGGIFYLGGCILAAGILTFIFAMFRSVQSRDEWKSWRTFALFSVLCLGGPYIFAEVMTTLKGKEMKSAVLSGLNDAGIEGRLAYYKVIWEPGDSARVIAVAEEMENWGGTVRSVVALTLKKKGTGWTADSYKIVNSDKHNKDGFSFPPYF